MAEKVPKPELSTTELAARALLLVEWEEHGGPVYSCRGCGAPWSFQRDHDSECYVDRALTQLGYPTRQSRDAARQKLVDADFKERWGFTEQQP
jgi:hypothetical protein